MKLSRRVLVGLLVSALLMLTSISGVLAQGSSAVRFVHVVPSTAPIDVYINGSLAVVNLGYGEATGYISVPAGDHSITVTPTGVSTPLWQQTVTADVTPATLIASSAGQFNRVDDNLTPLALGVSRLLLVHALAGGPNVDVQLAESVAVGDATFEAGFAIGADMAYATSIGTFDLPSQTYLVNVVPTGAADPVISGLALNLDTGTSQMAVVYGTAANPQVLVLSAPTAASGDSGFVRFAHGVVGAPNVDVYVNDVLVSPQLDVDNPTAHVALPVGEHTAELRVGDDAVAKGTVSVTAGSAQTIIALADGDGVSIASFADDVSGVSEGSAVATVINAITEASVTVDLSTGAVLASDVAFGSASSATSFDPTVADVNFTLQLGDVFGNLVGDEVTFYGGNYYNIIILDGNAFSAPAAIVAPTTLAQGLSSAPGAGTMIVDNTTDTGSEVTVATPDAPAVVTSAPQVVPSGEEGVVTAQVVLDPSANLQLRQYPNPDSLSLGLAPANTTLVIEGREGRPVALVEGQDPPPEAETFVDLAEGLPEDEDLAPDTTWLRVVYTTPDGGTIEAWVLAQFLIIRDADGDLQRLANLPTVAGNIPGEASGTELTPPSEREDIVTARVYNLNIDARLNMRRTPTVEGEVLARIQTDTVVELLGFLGAADVDEGTPTPTPTVLEDIEWVFISYNPPEGGTITGWVSTTYVQFFWNGARVDPEELFERELTDYVSADTIGRITGGAQQAAVPTADPLEDAYVVEVVLDANANLQFRRSPDATSESIGLIASGTQLVATGRTPASDWVQVSFEGQTGWISSQFITVSFNGVLVDVTDIPVAADVVPESTEEASTSG